MIAFEPDPWAHATLQRNIADLDNIVVEYAAGGHQRGDRTALSTRPNSKRDPASYSESSSVIAVKWNVVEEGAVEVRQIDFIRYLEDLDEDIGILKIDIEGAEVDLLEALLDRPDILKRVGYIFAETHETRIPGHEVRVNALREKARRVERPRINLDWN